MEKDKSSKPLGPDDYQKLFAFWSRMTLQSIEHCFENPDTSFYWLAIDERNRAMAR